MDDNHGNIVDSILELYPDREIPVPLQENIHRHQKHLSSLAFLLLESGYDAETVGEHLEVAFKSYHDELLASILALKDLFDDR